MGMVRWWNDNDRGKQKVLGEKYYILWVVGE